MEFTLSQKIDSAYATLLEVQRLTDAGDGDAALAVLATMPEFTEAEKYADGGRALALLGNVLGIRMAARAVRCG